MFFTLKELVRWLRMTGFEIWMHIVSVLIFSVLGILKYENVIGESWWIIFIPLFTCDGLCAYFCIIVFIRQYQELDLRVAGIRFLTSILSTMLFFVFKFLMCEKFSEKRMLSSSEVMAPLFILLQIVMIRACRLH
ncbi:transmembrane protein 203-like [Haliotis cracherodii]|uniref:transmembrane protein 203-like n=1 Tax=Haliotis cracherodii TaxID=6455 RepID=UPI0039E90587